MNTKLFRWLTGGACPRRYSSRRYSRSGCRIPLPLPCAASDLTKDPKRNVATDFRIDCKTCNIPAKKDDCVYVRGYPVLKKPTSPK